MYCTTSLARIKQCMYLLGESFERGRVYRATYVDVYWRRVSGSGGHAGYSGHLLVISWCSRCRWCRRRRIRHCGRRGRRTAWRQQSEKDTFDISHHQAVFLLRGFEIIASIIQERVRVRVKNRCLKIFEHRVQDILITRIKLILVCVEYVMFLMNFHSCFL